MARVRRQIGLGPSSSTPFPSFWIGHGICTERTSIRASAFVGQVTPGSVVVDVGANIGQYALMAAASTGPQGRVLAVEPNLGLHARILRNLALSKVTNIELISRRARRSRGRRGAHGAERRPALGTLASVTATHEPSIKYKVPIRRLDSLSCQADHRQRLSVMKVDVEGWELEVFVGGRETLAAVKPVVFGNQCGAEQFERQGERHMESPHRWPSSKTWNT